MISDGGIWFVPSDYKVRFINEVLTEFIVSDKLTINQLSQVLVMWLSA